MYVLVRACIGAAPIIFFDIQLLKTEIKKPDFLDTCIYRCIGHFPFDLTEWQCQYQQTYSDTGKYCQCEVTLWA